MNIYEEQIRRIITKWIGEKIDEAFANGETNSIAASWMGQTYTILLVWSSKVLQNYKCTVFTTLPNSPYFELTYNGDKMEWYLDVYHKTENKRIDATSIGD